MVTLDYRTNNPRWGLRGIEFSNWQSYAFTIGYLSNPAHNTELSNSHNSDISIRIERNDKQGAWATEGRIHFYGSETKLGRILPDLYDCSIDGVGRITKRIDSNGFIRSLIDDYAFDVCPRMGNNTADVFPPNVNMVKDFLVQHLGILDLDDDLIDRCLEAFGDGFNI